MTADFILPAATVLLGLVLIFVSVCGIGGFFPDDIYVVVVDGVRYYDVRDISVAGDTISFNTGSGIYLGVRYALPYTQLEVIHMHKGFFQKEYVEVLQ